MRKLAMLGMVLIGIMFLMNGVVYIAYPFSAFSNGFKTGWPALVVAALPALAYLVGGAFLITRRAWLAGRFFPDEDAPLAALPVDLVRTGLVLVGAFMMASAVPSLFNLVASGVMQVTVFNSGQALTTADAWQEVWGTVPGVLATLVSFAVGWFLVARSRSLTDRLLREPKPPAPAPVVSGPACPSCGAPYDPADYRGGLVTPRCPACGSPLDVTAS